MAEMTPERAQPVSLELYHALTQFLYQEAELLDDWRFRDWLDLLSQDVEYTMRTNANAQTRDRRRGVQPPTTWIFNDTHAQLERRIARLETGMAWAEEPPSRTRHLVTNIVVKATQHPDEFDIRLNYLLHRQQKERDLVLYAGKRMDRVRRADTAAGWQICRREIVLDQATLTTHNLSVLF